MADTRAPWLIMVSILTQATAHCLCYLDVARGCVVLPQVWVLRGLSN